MPAQLNFPVNRVSTDVNEFEGYLRKAAEFAGKNCGSYASAFGTTTQMRRVLSGARAKRRRVIAHPKAYRKA